MRSLNVSPKKLSLAAAAGAVAVMGVVTFAAETHEGTSGGTQRHGRHPDGVGDRIVHSAVPSAVPAVKATKFAGGDWTGM